MGYLPVAEEIPPDEPEEIEDQHFPKEVKVNEDTTGTVEEKEEPEIRSDDGLENEEATSVEDS